MTYPLCVVHLFNTVKLVLKVFLYGAVFFMFDEALTIFQKEKDAEEITNTSEVRLSFSAFLSSSLMGV